MGQAQINVRTRACSRTSIARTKQAALTHNVRGKELRNEKFRYNTWRNNLLIGHGHWHANRVSVQSSVLPKHETHLKI